MRRRAALQRCWAALRAALPAREPPPAPHAPLAPHAPRRSFASTAAAAAEKYAPSPGAFVPPRDSSYDVLILGGGHNGLTAAAYLARAGLRVCVLERRGVLGGAAVTEELVPGFRFSRASYLAGLLRPQIVAELQLHRHGLRYLLRDPSSFTPTRDGPSLLLGSDAAANRASIAQFSAADADAFPRYEAFLSAVRAIVSPLLDGAPPDALSGGARERLAALRRARAAARAAAAHPGTLAPLTELLTAPAAHILDRWFESDVLKATLATDAVIGAMCSPRTPGSAYVLLHHAMGSVDGVEGTWAYCQGGMGALSGALAAAACEAGAALCTNADVAELLLGDGGGVEGVRLRGGAALRAPTVLAACTPHHLFLELLPRAADGGPSLALPPAFARHVAAADYACGAFKVNLALSRLPQFACLPPPAGAPAAGPQHRGTVHFETHMDEIHAAYLQAAAGVPATRPVVELTLPSVLDPSLAPPGCHVAGLFIQFAPYHLAPAAGGSWEDASFAGAFADRAIAIVEEHCPGFAASVVGRDVLSPRDLERTFGLHQGNIFHGALALHQLAYNRPAPGWAHYRTPVRGLYLGGAGAHPGGGVMGAPGRNAAAAVLRDAGRAPWWDA
jgi:phytoene dehydrogenase-like protein